MLTRWSRAPWQQQCHEAFFRQHARSKNVSVVLCMHRREAGFSLVGHYCVLLLDTSRTYYVDSKHLS